jgi:hypothetical protein
MSLLPLPREICSELSSTNLSVHKRGPWSLLIRVQHVQKNLASVTEPPTYNFIENLSSDFCITFYWFFFKITDSIRINFGYTYEGIPTCYQRLFDLLEYRYVFEFNERNQSVSFRPHRNDYWRQRLIIRIHLLSNNYNQHHTLWLMDGGWW